MSKVMELSINIGGNLSPNLTSAINAVKKAFKTTSASADEAKKKLGFLETFTSLQGKMQQKTSSLRAAYERLSQAEQKNILYTGNDIKVREKLNRKYQEAQARVEQLKRQTQQLSRSNVKFRETNEAVYGSIHKIKEETLKLNRVIKQNNAILQQQNNIEKAKEARTNKLVGAEYRLQSAQRIMNAFRGPVEQAMAQQNMSFELSTVINATDKKAAIAQAEKSAQELAKAGYTSYADAMTAQYSLNSAGLSADLASVAVKTVASVAKVTKGELGQVGEVIATMNNNLAGKLTGTAAEKFQAIGNILTKVQFKYQIRDFNQLGESMKYASVGINQYNVDLKQSAAAIGMLNSAGLQGSMAGTAFNAMLKGLYKVAGEIPGILAKNKDGTLDLVGSLANLQKGLSKMDDVTKADFLNKMFGAEGAKGVVPLVAKTSELAQGYREIGNAISGNLVDQKMGEYLALTSTQMQAARQQAELLGAKLGKALLPTVTELIGYASKFADIIGNFAEAHPLITKLIVGFAGIGVALNLGGAAVMYVTAGFSSLITALQSGALALKVIKVAMQGGCIEGYKYANVVQGVQKAFNVGKLLVYKAATLAAAAATKIAAAAQWIFNAAIAANPITLVVIALAALGAAFVIAYKKSEKFRNVVKSIWEHLKKVGEIGKKVGKFIFGKGLTSSSNAENTPSSVPQYASGGYVGRPTLGMVGEAGPEMIVPLSNRAQGLQRLNQASAMLGATGGASINYAPNITITGNADRQQIATLLREHKSELKAMLEEIARDNRRVALS